MDERSSGFLQIVNIDSMSMNQLMECMEGFDYSSVEKPISWTIKKCRIHSTDGTTLREPTERNRSYYRRELTYLINQIQLDNLRRIEKRLHEYLDFEQLATSIDCSFKKLMTNLGCGVNYSNEALDEIKLKSFEENFKDCTFCIKENENVERISAEAYKRKTSFDRGTEIRSKCWDCELSIQRMMASVTAVENRWKTDKKSVYKVLIKSGKIVSRDDKAVDSLPFTWIPKVQSEEGAQENKVSLNICDIMEGVEDANLNELRGISDQLKAEVKKRIRSFPGKRNTHSLRNKMLEGSSRNISSRNFSNSSIENMSTPLHPHSISQLLNSPVLLHSPLPSFDSNLSPGTFNTMSSFGNLSMSCTNENNAPVFHGFQI